MSEFKKTLLLLLILMLLGFIIFIVQYSQFKVLTS